MLDRVGTDVGLHLHDTRGTALLNAWTAIERGVDPLRHRRSAGSAARRSPPPPAATWPPRTSSTLLDDAGLETGIDLDALLAIGPPPRRARRPRPPQPRGRRRWRRDTTSAARCCWTPPADALDGDGRRAGFATAHGLRRLRRAARAGRSPTSTGSGGRRPTFTGVRWHDAADGDAATATRCPACAGSPAPRSTTPSTRSPRPPTARTTSPWSPAARPAAPIELTWAELRRPGRRRGAAGLRRLGVGAGDRVVAYAPNIPETLVAFLATASIGAVWSSCAPEFGVRSVIDRFAQIEPAVLVAVDGYRYGAKDDRPRGRGRRDRRRPADAAPRRRTCRYLGPGRRRRSATSPWADLARRPPAAPAFEPVPADHPLYVLFSSGTTGLPKAIVHGHGGIVAEHLKVLAPAPGPRPRRPLLLVHHHRLDDVELPRVRPARRRDDRAVRRRSRRRRRSTRCGTSPPRPASPCFGVSAPFLMACRKAGVTPPPGRLRWVGSTGAPLPADGFRWVARRASACRWRRSRRHRRVHRVRRLVAAGAGARRRDQLPAARLRRRGVHARRPAVPARRDRRAGHHRADAVDAGRLLGRRRRLAATAPPTSRTSPACGATATGSRSPTTAPA